MKVGVADSNTQLLAPHVAYLNIVKKPPTIISVDYLDEVEDT